MRILGYGPDHPDIVRARICLHKKGGVLEPHIWGKLLPTWVPGHPSTYWCHARHILLATTYCQLSRLSAEEDELIRSLRQELYVEDYSSIDWPAQKKYISEADLQAPHTLVLDVLFALFNLYDRYHLTSLRKKATAEIYELIKADDIFSNSTNSSPLLNMRNSDGGFSSYETRCGSWLLENINCAETYADCMVDHTYIECTSSVMQGLKYFQKRFPDHRREEIRQMKDAGWGEEFKSYKFRKYIQHTISQIHQTAWALLGLMAVRYPDVRVLERGIQVLIDKQRAIGDWPQGDIATGFYKAGTLHYSAYRNIFPIFALARFTHLYPNSPLARQHLKTGPRHSTESQTVKH
ncbi:lanosterol synthase-like [Crotalus adamanteus]|uniref:Lanosterol synthase-like n=1 Tax=Crotalus adamanteus TaxID=8729 RepID=A0AAW1BQ81_CROAD